MSNHSGGMCVCDTVQNCTCMGVCVCVCACIYGTLSGYMATGSCTCLHEMYHFLLVWNRFVIINLFDF